MPCDLKKYLARSVKQVCVFKVFRTVSERYKNKTHRKNHKGWKMSGKELITGPNFFSTMYRKKRSTCTGRWFLCSIDLNTTNFLGKPTITRQNLTFYKYIWIYSASRVELSNIKIYLYDWRFLNCLLQKRWDSPPFKRTQLFIGNFSS